jgi:hypothetical protein
MVMRRLYTVNNGAPLRGHLQSARPRHSLDNLYA